MSSTTRSISFCSRMASALSAETAVWISHVLFPQAPNNSLIVSRKAMLSSTKSTRYCFGAPLAASGFFTGAGAVAGNAAEGPGAVISRRNSTSPRRKVCPGRRMASVMGWPSMNVPLVDRRSRTSSSFPRSRTSQCWPETDASTIWNALSSPRPIVTQCVPRSYDKPFNSGLMATSLDIRNGYFPDVVL